MQDSKRDTDFWTLWEKVRVGWFERIALKHVYYHTWNRSPVQVWCMRQGAQCWCTGWPWGMGWGGRWGGGSGWGTHVHPWLIHVNVWQEPLQYCKVIEWVKSLNCVRLLATPWTAAYQAPPSMGFSRREYWSGVPSPSPTMHYALHILNLAILFCVWKMSHAALAKAIPKW